MYTNNNSFYLLLQMLPQACNFVNSRHNMDSFYAYLHFLCQQTITLNIDSSLKMHIRHGPVKYNGIIHSHSKQKPAYQVDTLEALERENNKKISQFEFLLY